MTQIRIPDTHEGFDESRTRKDAWDGSEALRPKGYPPEEKPETERPEEDSE